MAVKEISSLAVILGDVKGQVTAVMPKDGACVPCKVACWNAGKLERYWIPSLLVNARGPTNAFEIGFKAESRSRGS